MLFRDVSSSKNLHTKKVNEGVSSSGEWSFFPFVIATLFSGSKHNCDPFGHTLTAYLVVQLIKLLGMKKEDRWRPSQEAARWLSN